MRYLTGFAFVLWALVVPAGVFAQENPFSALPDTAAMRQMAEKGDADSQLALGVMYALGQDVPQDDAEAIKWFRLAAKQGLPEAQYNLALMYDRGRGVPQDYLEAVKWYCLAAEQGLAQAQSGLAIMYGKGQGVPQDYVEAHMWFNLAAAQGLEKAAAARDALARVMTPADISEAQRRAREWLDKHKNK